MTPYQLFFEGVNHLVRYYGYSVPSLDGDIDVSELTGEHVIVPRISFIPCTLCYIVHYKLDGGRSVSLSNHNTRHGSYNTH